MKWKNADYPYSYNEREKGYMDRVALPNFKKFKEITGVDKIDVFNYGYDMERVFNGENPRYNPNILDCDDVPDHTNFIYRNSKAGATYVIGFSYGLCDGEIIRKFCKKYGVACVIFAKEYSFYHSPGTWMYVFAKPDVLQRFTDRITCEENNLFLNGKLNNNSSKDGLWDITGYDANNEIETRTIRGNIVEYVNNICKDLKIYRIERMG